MEELVWMFDKSQPLEPSAPHFVLNRILSMNRVFLPVASKIDKYIFKGDKEILSALLQYSVPKSGVPNFQYIKSVDEQSEEFDFVLEPMRKFLAISDTDLQAIKPIMLNLFKDRKVLYKYMIFFGVNKKYFDDYGFEIKLPDVKKVEGKLQLGLDAWGMR